MSHLRVQFTHVQPALKSPPPKNAFLNIEEKERIQRQLEDQLSPILAQHPEAEVTYHIFQYDDAPRSHSLHFYYRDSKLNHQTQWFDGPREPRRHAFLNRLFGRKSPQDQVAAFKNTVNHLETNFIDQTVPKFKALLSKA